MEKTVTLKLTKAEIGNILNACNQYLAKIGPLNPEKKRELDELLAKLNNASFD